MAPPKKTDDRKKDKQGELSDTGSPGKTATEMEVVVRQAQLTLTFGYFSS